MTTKTQTLSPEKEKLRSKLLNPFTLKLFMLTQLPAGLIAGLRIKELDSDHCVTSVPFKYLNKNPFQSIYFAVMSMAAELSTATLVMLGIHNIKPSIALIIVNIEAQFTKKAIGRTFFTCEGGDIVEEAVEKAIQTGEAQTIRLKTVGKLEDGTEVAEFYFTWSIKQRSKK